MKQLPNASRFAPLRSLLQIEAGEGQPVALLFALACTLALAVVFVQAMAFGLFVRQFGAPGLPFAYVSIAVLASAIALAYLKLAERWSLATLLRSRLLFMGAGCVLFWGGLVSPLARGFVFLLPLWFQVLSNLCNLALWPLAGRSFDVRQGKRLFALIGAGFWSANIIGGFIVSPLSGLIGAQNLLLCAAVSVGLALACLRRITRDHLAEHAPRVVRARPQRIMPAASLLNNRYVSYNPSMSAVVVRPAVCQRQRPRR